MAITEKANSHTTYSMCAGRMSAKDVLLDNIKRKQKKTEALQIIHDELPWKDLTKNQEEILWNFFCSF